MADLELLSEPALSEGPQPIQEYRALSVWAIAALLLGLFSALTLVAPLLAIVPLVAMVVGAIALYRIAADSERLAGRWMALVPFILAPLFLGWSLTREFSRRERMYTHAREFADDWLQILNQNQPHFAHQLWMQRKERLDPQSNLEVAYQQNEKATEGFTMFLEARPMKDILEAAPRAKFHFEEFVSHEHGGLIDVVTMRYSYETPTTGTEKMWITAKRTYSIYTGRPDWNISGVALQPPR